MSYLSRFFKTLTILVLSVQLMACGTILYPERRGQTSGRLDVGVVLLDGIGLLFFLIPGIIAYAVDFSTGAIYLPGGDRADNTDQPREFRVVRVNPKQLTLDTLKEIIREETGHELDLSDPRLRIVELDSAEELPVRFAGFKERAAGQMDMALAQ